MRKSPSLLYAKSATLVQDVDPFLHKLVRLQVPRDREAEARELLESVLQPVDIPQDAEP